MDAEELVGERGVLLEEKAQLAIFFENAEGVGGIGRKSRCGRSRLKVGYLPL